MDNKIERYINLNGLEQKITYSGTERTEVHTVSHDAVPIYGKGVIEVLLEKKMKEEKKYIR